MSWNTQIDNYCERAAPEFWAEPWNAVTNAAFIIAAVIALVIALRARRLGGAELWLISLVGVIGVGSFLFHTFATRWSALADVAPIGLFILTYFTVCMNRFFGFGWGASAALTLLWVLALGAMSYAMREGLLEHIGGTVSYLPAYVGLVVVGALLWRQGHPAGTWLLFAANVFAASLLFRGVDLPACHAYEHGTHFLWHILNGVVLGTLAIAVVRHGRASA